MPDWARRLKAKGKSHISRQQASTIQPLQPVQQHNLHVPTSAPVLATRNPFEDKGKLLRDAIDKLPAEDRQFIQDQLGSNSNLERDAARVETSRDQNQTKRSNQWTMSMRKIACQIKQFAPVFDVATNAQAEVLSMPWAGIRSLLMVAQKTHEQSESILKGIETVLDTGHLLNVYFDIYGQLNAASAIGHLYDNIVKLYGLNLTFVAHAQHTCDMEEFKRMIHSLTGQVIPKFNTEHDRMLSTVEYHARAVDREVSEEQRAWVKQKLNKLEKAQQEVNQGIQGVQQALDLSALQAAAGAAYDSINYSNSDDIGELQLCLDGTRVQIRQKILDWATTANDQRVFWLSGKAGTGKSTIARTVADELARQGYLVGSFFFKRGQGELGRARNLFPTIARRMADSIPSIGKDIAAASHGLPPVDERPLTNQFDKLIKEPLLGYYPGGAPDVRVIVIDALDECEDWGAIGHAMTFWSKLGAHTSINLRVFVTSRPDNKVGNELKKLEGKDLQHERLEDLQIGTIEQDLASFCNDELRQLREKSSYNSSHDALEADWPGEVVVNKLVDICQPLFIAASPIFRDVASNPRQRLQRWVDRLNFTGADALTVIYMDILEHAADLDKEWLRWFNKVVKPIILLLSPLTITAPTDLLGQGDNMIVPNTLKPVSSVIDFPSGKETKAGSRAAVQVYHDSFRDFLLDPSLKGKYIFWTDRVKTHGVLLSRCLDLLMTKLSQDVCKQKNPGTGRKDVSAEDVEKHIPESVQYACRYWTSHAVKSNKALEDGGQVDCFLRASFLYWTEALAWLDKLGEMIICLNQLQKAINSAESMPNPAQSKSSPRLHSFVADALRWVSASRDTISDAPLQTYLSALTLAPSSSIVRNTFWHEVEDLLQVWPPVATVWGFELQILRGHTDDIRSIAPSIDGRRLVTVGRDNTVRLWDVESGTEEKRTEIDIRNVKTSSGYYLRAASAFPEEDIVVIAKLSGGYWRWNLEDDARPIDIKLPSVEESDEESDEERDKESVAKSAARSVSVSPNGRYAAWGLCNGEIYIWDAENDAGQVVEGHSSWTLASASTDIWKWSPQAGHERICQVGTDIKCIAISPNGKFVVFGSVSDTISVFHCTTHKVEQIMQSQKVLFGNWSDVYLYDFQTQQESMELPLRAGITAMTPLPDGKTIWAGDSFERIIQLDLDLVLKSPQHRSGDNEIALSADGRSLALWSQGNQLSVWNIETRICEQRLTDHRLSRSSRRWILISSDSRFVVVACTDDSPENVVLIWDLEANALREPKDRSGKVTALALSPDNKTLLCGLDDGQVWAIDLERGVLREKFTGHTKEIYNIAISPDEQSFVSASYDYTIRIWGPKSQTPLVLSLKDRMEEARFLADGRMLYTYDKDNICEWDIEKACIVRTLAGGLYSGSILIDGRFVPSELLPVKDRLAVNEADQPQRQDDSSAATKSTSMFQSPQIWGLDYEWITVDGRKILKHFDLLSPWDWFSCERTMVFRNGETGFTVLYLTGNVSF
ncbi:hypothetical protein K470DRAFT_266411 [Piedraia hortae CBS 480.64]|uniref:WD40 repeat-like protein n=1 Tax=Piedraia hortae CBS 480.64 TaxID=1314780 RepID=A0A6A7BSE4_9PEZI|nr:hypothetical protein K470DRAFT_266411 [Piedraia hortae CBS 480.64]